MSTARTQRGRGRSGRELLQVGIAVICLLYCINIAFSGNFSAFQQFFSNARTQVFTIVLIAILLEGFPFLLLGAFLSALIELAVPKAFIDRRFPRRAIPAVVAGALLGFLFPVCSCGTIPVTRRLIRKGVPTGGAIAYLLAAPIVNPITIASTILAFPTSAGIPVGRILLVIGLSVTCGLLFSHLPDPLLPDPGEQTCSEDIASPIMHILHHTGQDFLRTGPYLVPGAAAAALFQTFVSRQALVSIAGKGIIAALFMQAAAMGFCLCSFADAFVAASFTVIPAWAKVIFLVAGPAANIAVISLYFGTFRRPYALRLIIAITGLLLAAAILGGIPGGAG